MQNPDAERADVICLTVGKRRQYDGCEGKVRKAQSGWRLPIFPGVLHSLFAALDRAQTLDGEASPPEANACSHSSGLLTRCRRACPHYDAAAVVNFCKNNVYPLQPFLFQIRGCNREDHVSMAYKRSRQTFESDLQKQASPFVVYGTPLPPFDENTRDDGSFVPVWQQEVTDERGRKRLHGAFTGGFSAG
jgi:hypothetical protein